MKARYIGLIHKDEGSAFGVSFPDVAGCFAVHETLEGLVEYAQECLESHFEFLAEEGQAIPSSSRLAPIADEQVEGLVAICLIEVTLP